MKVAATCVAAAICAFALTGCEAISFGEPLPSNTNKIRVISRQQESACRLISHLEGHSAFPPDHDLYTAAFERVRTKAAGQSANAVLERSYQVQTGMGGSRATLYADSYACPSAHAED
jgi:hypothetical protein